ncbi:hypothetical protein [Bradyrhizobium valentinum]|uniref:hypothetical protein n=1 Tax=Bradyrhizobium valentinum TaxID=1518501 RepID=UPI0007101B37|nr:hypothetical protein [Bradyrhizobium valentinum]KRQ95415.1 hypothetical protein CQ10_32645 [Bradyrhizobium valentinum]
MVLKKSLIVCTAVLALTSGTASPAKAGPWTRGFVVSNYEYAYRYGGPPKGEVEPGVDCPHGSSRHFVNDLLRKIALTRQKWRSQKEIDWILKPPGLDEIRDPGSVRTLILSRAISYRGYKPGIETYINPWAAEDPGQPEVTSRIADGFNLDGKIGPNDFVSPDGEKGIDNALYRAWGCDNPWRGDGNATLALRVNNAMQDGLYTMVIRISGNQDPMNDSNATVEIGYSPDKIVRDARGGIAQDFSYRILESAQYTRLKATIKKGVVETEQIEHLHIPRVAWFYDQTGEANFFKGKIRLNMGPDGSSVVGLIGGYRKLTDLYADASFGGSSDRGASGLDIFEHQDHVALFYALRRNADGLYNKKTGYYDAISTAYRIKASSAFIVDPDHPMDIPEIADQLWRKKAFEASKLNTIKGIETRVPQGAPPGSREAAYPALEAAITDLPSRDFFLKTLDRPHYPDGVGLDIDGNPIDDQGNRIDKGGNKLSTE